MRSAELTGNGRILIRADEFTSLERKIRPADRDEWPHLFRAKPPEPEAQSEDDGSAPDTAAELLELVKQAQSETDLDALADEAQQELEGQQRGAVKRAITKRRKEVI